MPDFIIKFNQILSYFVFYIPRRILFNINITPPNNFGELKNGVLLVANHQSKLDPFIILSCIPFALFFRILPVRFPVLHEYMEKSVSSKILKLLGCYDIGGTSRENMVGFLYTRDLLKKGNTVFLFPEGKISKKGSEVENLKRGIEFFVKDSKSVVFARMKGFNEVKLPSFRAKTSISFSSVQDLTVSDVDTRDIMMIFNQL
jgi:1-acyl-sn-glycerol-3-phosphate acyltransferase